MPADDLIDLAINIITVAFGGFNGKTSPPPPTAPAQSRTLTDQERELANEIQRRRGVSEAVAVDLVVWLRSQAPGFHNEQRAP
jgi:hypothetical protein